ncbi:hypothetical protein K1719_027863 [Acacia pycnantha]|nr:hypothetical protein K1719_027863 [Acacia pycnantha]
MGSTRGITLEDKEGASDTIEPHHTLADGGLRFHVEPNSCVDGDRDFILWVQARLVVIGGDLQGVGHVLQADSNDGGGAMLRSVCRLRPQIIPPTPDSGFLFKPLHLGFLGDLGGNRVKLR